MGHLKAGQVLLLTCCCFVVKIVLGLSVRSVVFDIALEEDADEQETYDIIRSITEKFKTKFPEMKKVIKAEPKYAYRS